ncbi:MAG: nuclear transport factor 2 family protein [Chloroflexi bacterium]|nr:nuclear transport factor 2 family protein [Chloroflexota bacterium]
MSDANVKLVADFCRAWSRRDVDEIVEYFTEDAVYHNIPMPPINGKQAIANILRAIVGPASAIDWEVLNVAASGALVFTERIDGFEMAGRKVELPVAGVFEVVDGKIKAWRDYFDMATWTRQTSAG